MPRQIQRDIASAAGGSGPVGVTIRPDAASDPIDPPARRRKAGGGRSRCVVGVALWLLADAAGSSHARADHAKEPPARPVVVTSLGGALQDAQQKSFFAPFTAQTHVPVRAGSWDGTLAALQNRARTGADPAERDLVLMDNSSVLVACRQGLLLPIDPTLVPGLALTGPSRLDPEAISRCGLGALRSDLVLAWDKSRIDTAPGWSDFWDVARRPGKRGLARDPRGTLEIALLADGVAPDAVYRTLSSQEGLDRAFHKLDQLKPYIVWWDTPAQAARIIESGSVLMTSAASGEVTEADLIGHRDFGIQWQQSLGVMLSWAEPGRPPAIGSGPAAGHDVADRAQHVRQLLGFMADPARQEDFIGRYPALSLIQGVPPPGLALPEDSPATPEHLREALRQDDAFWAGNLEPIRARFDAWIGN